jgi:hypothetical protein
MKSSPVGRQRTCGIGHRGHVDELAVLVRQLFKTECITTTVLHNGPYKTLADVEYAEAAQRP